MKVGTFLMFFLIGYTTIAQKTANKSIQIYYRKIIQTLANDSLKGRSVSSVYEDIAAKFIYQEFKSTFSSKPQTHQFTYQTDSSHFSKNVYYFINNHADSTILIGAHYDHIGMGENRSRSYGKKGIHNGADDNASGVALMLAIAKRHKLWSSKKYNYVFVAYSAHEIGLFGSAAFAIFCRNNFPPLSLVINFDMVGRFDEKARVLNIYGLKTLRQQQTFFINATFNGKIYTNESDKIFMTDAKVFAEAGISSLSFTTGLHEDYHKISDDEIYINYDGIQMIEQLIEDFLKIISSKKN